MKALKKLAVFCVGAALTVGSAFGFAACDNGTDPQGYDDPNIREVYSLYVASAEESGNEPMTYEEWLASIKGKDGAPGKDGKNGKDGSSFLHGEGAPKAADGKAGDLYLDIETGDLYEKTAEGWSSDPVGNLKGPKGDPATGGEETEDPTGTVIKEYSNVTIDASGNYDLDLSEVDSGYYWLVADTQTTAAAGVLSADSVNSYMMSSMPMSSTVSYDLYSSKSECFKGIVIVDGDSSKAKVTVNNKSANNITADLKLVEYTPINLTLGEEVEIPCLSSPAINDGDGRASVLFDTATMCGQQLKITVSYLPDSISKPLLRYNSVAGENPTNIDTGNSWPTTDKDSGVWVHTFTMPANAVELFFLTGDRNGSGCNAVVKIELAS